MLGWLQATSAVRPFRRLAAQTRMIDAGDAAPDIEIRCASEAVELVPASTVVILGMPAGPPLAVDNAIANAVKHGDASHVRPSAVTSRAGVDIVVDDDGTGVPEDERREVFERFTRGSTASRYGSGLGLALVAQQAEMHSGTAALEESPLGGTRLVLRLPAPHRPG